MGSRRGAAERALGRVFRRLVDFDDVAVRIVEKYLLPARHRPVAIVRIFDAFFIETLLERIEIVMRLPFAALRPRGVRISSGTVDLSPR